MASAAVLELQRVQNAVERADDVQVDALVAKATTLFLQQVDTGVSFVCVCVCVCVFMWYEIVASVY